MFSYHSEDTAFDAGVAIDDVRFFGCALPPVQESCSDEEFRGILYAIDLAINNESRFIWIPKLSVANEKYELTGSDVFMM